MCLPYMISVSLKTNIITRFRLGSEVIVLKDNVNLWVKNTSWQLISTAMLSLVNWQSQNVMDPTSCGLRDQVVEWD